MEKPKTRLSMIRSQLQNRQVMQHVDFLAYQELRTEAINRKNKAIEPLENHAHAYYKRKNRQNWIRRGSF